MQSLIASAVDIPAVPYLLQRERQGEEQAREPFAARAVHLVVSAAVAPLGAALWASHCRAPFGYCLALKNLLQILLSPHNYRP